METTLQLDALCERLKLLPDDSLQVYAMLQTWGRPTCGGVDDYEEGLARHLAKQVKKLDLVQTQMDAFILSGGRDSSFRGLCLLRPIDERTEMIEPRGGCSCCGKS